MTAVALRLSSRALRKSVLRHRILWYIAAVATLSLVFQVFGVPFVDGR